MAKRFIFIAAVIAIFTSGFYLRDSLLTTTDGDFNYRVMLVPAKHLTAPLPGKNYARTMDAGHFDPVSICAKKVRTEFDPHVMFSGKNVVGVAYNNAVSASSFLLSEKVISWLKVETPVKEWKMSVVAKLESGNFEEWCWKKIEKRLRDQNVQVFTVTNVYYETPEKIEPILVLFEENSIVIDGCEDQGNCRNHVNLASVVRANWLHWAKAGIVNIH